MKPVNLNPGDSPVAVAVSPGARPNMGVIGGAIAGVVAVVAVGGYFAMARVDSVKSETAAANQRAQQASSDTQATRAQIESIGQPVVDSDKQLAQGAEQVLVAAYTERYDFVLLAKELRGVMAGTGGWYESIDASSTGDGEEGADVTIVGYMPTKELAASFDQRVSGTKTLADANFAGLQSVRLTELKSKRRAEYWKFTITADLVDTTAPFADGGSVGSDATGSVVGDGGGAGGLTLSLDPEPRTKARAKAAGAAAGEGAKGGGAAAAPAAPRNPFDVAASAARGGDA